MDEYNFFELAGYTKEESIEFENICREYDLDYHTLLYVLKSFK